ncbi:MULTISPECIES: phytanoyl-CoA dioxygenase [Tenacibaculum]|uniref:phytanoyl-CoA dioxygenase n=1 Tax=Tenacibaculum TaxID=104267 RepID=UPI001EF2A3A5|nr:MULTISPECIES: phytanoyl-CoA dioxygenase [Tenacibaculum]MCG7500530.1 phytanoyl-CoA dioxygenase [Tenacibaculum sp. Mcav3-52]MCO7184424.1 phytanoyl-CoA dioxygenase [Tenacibaculum sp. XPcli2-G]
MNENITALDIKEKVSTLLKDSIEQSEIENLINEIHTYFKELTQLTGFDNHIEHLAAITTSKGKALGLNHAAQCLLDYKRTVKFLKAMVMAIKEKQQDHPNETIHIFYAGCGPYAPFVTLIAPLFSPEEIQFSLLEINDKSLKYAKILIQKLELTNYVTNYYTADAVTFKIPEPEKFHILFSETLDALLYRECYVPILFNLLPQLSEDIAVIPENVLIKMSLSVNSITDSKHITEEIDTIINVREVISLNKSDIISTQLPDKKVAVKSLNIEQYNYLLLDTLVHIYDNIWLTRNESSLTIPLEMGIEHPFLFNSIVYTYQMHPDIELKYKLEQ